MYILNKPIAPIAKAAHQNKMNFSKHHHVCWTLPFACFFLALGGCADRPVIPVSADAQVSSGQNQDYFDYAVDNLNHLSQFGPTQILSQIVDRLNQWNRIEQPQTAWQLDPLLATLPEALQTGPLISNLEESDFSNYDGAYLRECALLNGVSNYATLHSSDDLSAARDLFEWTVSHVRLDPEPAPSEPRTAQLPWQTLLLGHGSPVDRAWLFTLLARQLDLDAVLLYLPAPNGDNKQPALQLWCVGIILNGQIFLFDPTYGLPLPGPDGGIATLSEVRAGDDLLRAWDLPDKPYWATEELLTQMVPFVEASSQSLSKRIKTIQNAIGRDNRMRLVSTPSQIADQVDALDQTSRPRIWPWPFLASRILANPENADRTRIASEMQHYGKFVTGSVNPLWAGRLQQLAGRYTTQIEGTPRRDRDAPIGEKGAKPLLLASRTMLQKFPKDDIPPEIKEQMEFLYDRSDVIRRDATRHLATIALDEGNFELADYYLTQTDKQQKSSTWPTDTPKISTTMARGRVAEAAGQNPEAIKFYRAVQGPEQGEAALRVKRIQTKLSAENQQ